MNKIALFFKSVLFSTILILIPNLHATTIPANGATNISNDMQFKITFNSAPVLANSGKVNLYKEDGSLVETIDLSKTPSGTPESDSWPWKEDLNSNDIRIFPVAINENTVYINFSIGIMTYNTSYYITVDNSIFSNSSSIGFSGISANQWNFKTRTEPESDDNYIVAPDGSGDFATLQGALNFIPKSNNNPVKINVKNGTYLGLTFIRYRNNVTVEGESKDNVIFKAFNNSILNASTHYRSVFNIAGDDITLINLTVINTTPYGGSQAEALKMSGERNIILNCIFYSYQDTVLLEGTIYLKDCLLTGHVDFIWGRGTVFFQSCELKSNHNSGYNVMARNDNSVHGYAFADCILSRTSSEISTQYLARDAGDSYPYGEVVYLNCTMGDQIPDVGWKLNSSVDLSKSVFGEYQSVNESGNLIDISKRSSSSKQLSASQSQQYRNLNWFFDGWTPEIPEVRQTPVITIINPTNNQIFEQGNAIDITVNISNSSDITKVEYYIENNLVDSKTNSPYASILNNLENGTYNLKAIATDNENNKITSNSISFTVIDSKDITNNISRKSLHTNRSIVTKQLQNNTLNITYKATQTGLATFNIYNYLGEKVSNITKKIIQNQTINFDANTRNSGAFIVKIDKIKPLN